jgi:hypothetical protein
MRIGTTGSWNCVDGAEGPCPLARVLLPLEKSLLTLRGEPRTLLSKIDRDEMATQERLAEISVHEHVGDHRGAVDLDAGRELQLESLIFLRWIETERRSVFLGDERYAACP